MVKYSCEKCGKDFTQKGHYTNHINKKNPCVFERKIDEIIEKAVAKKINEMKTNEAILDNFSFNMPHSGVEMNGFDQIQTDINVKKTNTIDEVAINQLDKKMKGQFYTVNSSYILDGLSMPPKTARCVIEPFAGKGDLIEWLVKTGNTLPIESYDIDPKREDVIRLDTLMNPPNYTDSWIITNPPYLARNKCDKKEIFDMYDTNDLYKCFITSLTKQEPCAGGIFIIPAGFFLSPRDLDVRCRNDFLSKYKLLKVKYFEETVFPDTTTTVVAFAFEKSHVLLNEQTVEWVSLPSGDKRIFKMSKENNWIIGGDIYKLSIPVGVKVRRHVEGQKLKDGEQRTFMTLSALDSGRKDGRIGLEYKEGYVYPAKDCSRTFATLCIQGRTLTSEEQKKICLEFNSIVEKKRTETWSLFLPQFRESKEYARKRIPFELAYTIVLHILDTI